MLTETDVQEYLEEIREQVCTHCVERPLGGPPCAPLGKACGVELHLPQLVESIRSVDSGLLQPYLEHNRRDVCTHCAYLHSSICPCPMDYLAALVVQAVETVGERQDKREQAHRFVATLPLGEGMGLEEIDRAYEAGSGTWIGCDWPTSFSKSGLNLDAWTAAEAAATAVETAGTAAGADWAEAAKWLARFEDTALQAEQQAAAAVACAHRGDWQEALRHVDRAWGLEFLTGRPIWRAGPTAWARLRDAVRGAAAAAYWAAQG